MAIKVNQPGTTLPSADATKRPHSGGSQHKHEGRDAAELLPRFSQKVQQLNRRPAGDWDIDDYYELERLGEALLASAEHEAERDHPQNPHAQSHAVALAKMQLRILLQTLQPPAELIDVFAGLWERCQGDDPNEYSTFVKRTIMNARVRSDVMNRQLEEAVDEADRLATQRRRERVLPIDADEHHDGQQAEEQGQTDEEAQAPLPDANCSLKHSLRLLKRRRRPISSSEAEEVAGKALATMRALRETVAPRWAPETQPWLLNNADNHVFHSVLAVVPEDLFRETCAFDGIQSLRSGQHAFGVRAESQLQQAAARNKKNQA